MSDLKAWNCEAGAIYGIRSIPATILFGPDGKIVATDLRGEELQKKLEEIYRKPQAERFSVPIHKRCISGYPEDAIFRFIILLNSNCAPT